MKKCPYCAEQIQDEAVVCRYCGRSLSPVTSAQALPTPAQPAKKGMSGWLIGLLVIIGGIVFVCACGMVFYSIGSDAKSSTAAAPVNPNNPISRPTSRPMLGMDLGQFVAKYDSLTDLQKKHFVGQSVGKWVDWQGEIFDVQSNGTITVSIPGTLASMVYLKGVSQADAASLTKGATIHFSGRISDITEFLGLNIYLADVRLTP